MKKLLGIILTVVMVMALSVPAFAEDEPTTTTITWESSDFEGSYSNLDGSKNNTIKGITLSFAASTATAGGTDENGWNGDYLGAVFDPWSSYNEATFTFTSSVGKISKIEINADRMSIPGAEGWSGNDDHMPTVLTWEGTPADAVTLTVRDDTRIQRITSFVFTVEEPASEDVITEDNGSTPYDVTVGYTYTPGTDTAAKHFYVTLAFTLPTTLEYDGGVKAYKWNPETGAYEADSANDEDGSVDFTGNFSIVITNQSNVGIDYTVEYTADTNAIFATAAAEGWANAKGTVDTVAKGQEIGEDGITITDASAAIADKTGDFASATCTGSITVTGINEGKTPSTETGSTDKLGMFKVTIGEEDRTLTIAEIVAMSDIPGSVAGAAYSTPWKAQNCEKGSYTEFEKLVAIDVSGNFYRLPLDETATKNADGKYVAESDNTKWTFTIMDDVLISFDVETTGFKFTVTKQA